MKTLFLAILCSISFSSLVAQNDSSKLEVSGYLDFYYSYDFNSQDLHGRPYFLYSYGGRNSLNMNLGLIRASYKKDIVKVNIALQTGSFAGGILDPDQLLQELNFELQLNKSKSLTLKTGLFTSHLGFESAIGADNICLSQSLVSENSPYFLFGSQLCYKPNEKIEMGAIVSNGWDLQFPRNAKRILALGSFISYKPRENWKFYWATFNENLKKQSYENNRFYNNLFTKYRTKKFSFILGFDYGRDKRANKRDGYWYIPTGIVQLKLSSKIEIGIRGEYFFDEKNTIITTPLPYPLKTGIFGTSANLDFKISEIVLFRIENRYFSANYRYFQKGEDLVYGNNAITTSLSARF